jgi:hypothetical protein
MNRTRWTLLISLIAAWSGPASARRPPVAPAQMSASASAPAATSGTGHWTVLTNPPPFHYGASTQLLLTDGTVMVFDQGYSRGSNQVWKLTPDINGSYVNGTWSQLASYPDYLGKNFSPYSAAYAVLADGRLLVAGGENNPCNKYSFIESNLVALYDPISDSWSTIDPPSWCTEAPNIAGLFNIPGYEGTPFSALPHGPPYIGDSISAILPDGTLMLGCQGNGASALLDPTQLTWTQTGFGKLGNNHEEGWALLPNGTVQTVDLYVGIPQPPLSAQTGTEIYDPATGYWSPGASTIDPISNPVYTGGVGGSGNYPYPDHEVGSTCLRPDGTLVAIGGSASGYNGIYDTRTKKWSRGPTFPTDASGVQISAGDAPAALLPNGNILLAAGAWDEALLYNNPPAYFYEWTLNDNVLVPQPTTSDGAVQVAGNYLLLALPTGQVLSTDETHDVEIYTPADRSHNPAWEPVITAAPAQVQPGGSYRIDGVLFNGMSQGAVYGDDYQNATNWPLVRITNQQTGHVFYCRTHDHSYMGVAATHLPVHTFFDVPTSWAGQAMELGPSVLEVVANGIASQPITINVSH